MTQVLSPPTPRSGHAPTLRLPDFVIIGAAKSGTTTLFQYLCRHPKVFMSEPKEPEFFSRDERYNRGKGWYASLFSEAGENQLLGEASTTYTRWPHTPDTARRLAEMLPDARLIYMMRHPIERAYSHYRHHMRYGVSKSFEQALRDDDIYVDCSLYMMQIRRYLRHVAREQMHFILLDDLKRRPEQVLGDLQDFLSLERRDLITDEPVVANRSSSRHYLRHRLHGLCGLVPGLVPLAHRLPAWLKDAVYGAVSRTPAGKRLKRRIHVPPMLKQTRRILLERFQQPNAELSAFLDRDLSHWEK